MDPMFGYRKLVAYQKAKTLIKNVYIVMKKFPVEERYAICDQLRRASVSVTSNIAEGMGRHSSKEKIHFLEMAFTSLMEVSSQLDVANDLHYITDAELSAFDNDIAEVARLISGLSRSFEDK